ncbi:MAG: thiazole synthase, partial [Deltaproteobacteria bacterium]
MKDLLKIGDRELESRLFTGTGKYGSDALIPEIIKESGSQ